MSNIKDELISEMLNAVQNCSTNLGQPAVLGDGNFASPPLMFIGEAPGEQETLQSKPFVGKAGQNLSAFLKDLGLLREEIYITNAVKFRPVAKSDKGRLRNRTPTKKEIALFAPLLLREIELVSPHLIVTLGNTPLLALTGRADIGISHGRQEELYIRDRLYSLFPLYHPAAIIYNRSLKAVYDSDIQLLKHIIS